MRDFMRSATKEEFVLFQETVQLQRCAGEDISIQEVWCLDMSDNKALTLEQLREMDGEPVWVIYDQDAAKTTPGFDPLTFWALVEVTKNSVFLTNNFGGRTVYVDDQDLDLAGIAAYRRPPEGEEGDANRG